MKHEENPVRTTPCEICCQEIRKRPNYVTDHLYHEHPSEDQLNAIQAKCDSCSEVFKSAVELDQHVLICKDLDKLKRMMCGFCPENTTWNSYLSLRKHIAESHQKIRCYCDICENLFDTMQETYAHRKKVHKTKPGKESWKEWVETLGFEVNEMYMIKAIC